MRNISCISMGIPIDYLRLGNLGPPYMKKACMKISKQKRELGKLRDGAEGRGQWGEGDKEDKQASLGHFSLSRFELDFSFFFPFFFLVILSFPAS